LNDAEGTCECRFLHQAIPYPAEELLIIDTFALVWDVEAISAPLVNDTQVEPVEEVEEEDEEDVIIIGQNETEGQGNQTEEEPEVLPSDIVDANVTDE